MVDFWGLIFVSLMSPFYANILPNHVETQKTNAGKPMLRLCAWVDADLKAEFIRMVRNKHGGERGGTGMEMTNAVRAYLKSSRDSMRVRKDRLSKLVNLAADLEDVPGYPDMHTRLIRSVVTRAVGKDERTVKKYVRIVQANSTHIQGNGMASWNVSSFVKEVFRCNREGLNPRHIVGRADLHD